MNRKLLKPGIICFVLGLLAFSLVPPTFIPAVGLGTFRWQHIAKRVAYVSGCTGVVVGFGLALIIVSLFQKKNSEDGEE